MMRGGEQIVAANNQKERDTMPEVGENSWYSSIPGIDAATGALDNAKEEIGSFVDQTKTEGADLFGSVKNSVGSVTGLLPGGDEQGTPVASVAPVAPGSPVASVAPGAPGAPVASVASGSSWNPFTGSSWNPFTGGRRRQMRMKGGKSLGLDYYATPVNGIKVAQPTYMEYYKGGKRRRSCKRRRTRRSRSRSRRRSCKSHRKRR